MSLAAVMTVTSCADFLERGSLTSMDDDNFWASETNVRMYVNDCYGSYFCGYSDSWGSVYAPGVYTGEYSDDKTTTGTQFNTITSVPSDNWYRATLGYRGYWLQRRASGPWNFAYIRKWNHLIAKLDVMKDGGKIETEAYNHWMGVARFLRGWEYSRFVESFGDVPWYAEEVKTGDLDAQYAGRDPRTTVMDNVLADFEFAYNNVRSNDGTDYINKDVVATIASRCLLFEGSWYIFHKNDKALTATCSGTDAFAKKYLEAAVKLAGYVIDSGKYGFNTDFRTLFGTCYNTLTGTANEVILYRAYNKSVISGAQHCIASYSNGDESQSINGNLTTLEAFVCNDGKIYNCTEVAGAESWRLQDMVKTRDPRFEATFWDEPKNSSTGLYIEKFCNREGVTYAYNGQSRPTWCGSDTNENGFPCVRYAETVLNWVEAKCLLADYFGGSAVTQADLDKSINAIRTRPLDSEATAKGVQKTAPLTLAMAASMNDPKRTSGAITICTGYKTAGAASPLLWEIWRERRMEFVAEQVRPLDIRRWGQLELLDYDTNVNGHIGGYVELDLARTTADGQVTNLKKTKNNAGYDVLTEALKGVTCVYPFEGFNADGSLKLGNPIYWGKVPSANAVPNATATDDVTKMRGFLLPKNYVNRNAKTYAVENYLEPICTDVIAQYQDHYQNVVGDESKNPLKQTPGWEE